MESNNMKRIIRVLVVVAVILLAPLVAMQFSDEVDWGLADFIVVGALLIGAGLIYEFVVRKVSNATYRAVLGIALAVALLVIWIDLAVGIFGTPFSGN